MSPGSTGTRAWPRIGPASSAGGDLMHGAAGLGIARRQRAGMGVQAGILRQKRGVDVQHPAPEAVDEAGGQHAHEAGKAEDIGSRGKDRLQQVRPRNAARSLAEGAVVDRRDGHAERRCLGQARSASGSFEATSTGCAGWSPAAMSRTSASMFEPPPEIRMATRFTAGGRCSDPLPFGDVAQPDDGLALGGQERGQRLGPVGGDDERSCRCRS